MGRPTLFLRLPLDRRICGPQILWTFLELCGIILKQQTLLRYKICFSRLHNLYISVSSFKALELEQLLKGDTLETGICGHQNLPWLVQMQLCSWVPPLSASSLVFANAE